MEAGLEAAYKYCEGVTRENAKSFYFSAKFLPRNKQRPIYALYALCRHVDDEVDEAEVESELQAIEAVERWRSLLDEVYSNGVGSEKGSPGSANQNLVLLAWGDMLRSHKIPQELPLELMKGVLMDTHKNRYRDFDELYLYCYRVASVVGLMSSEILGYDGGDKTLEYAEALGIAMQLTNILRDIKEDAAMDRIYLPQEDLLRFEIPEAEIFENRMSGKFIEMMKFQIARARGYYAKAEKGIPMLAKDSRFCVLLASRIYARILDEIEKENYNVFAKRMHTSKFQKILSIPNIWLESRKL